MLHTGHNGMDIKFQNAEQKSYYSFSGVPSLRFRFLFPSFLPFCPSSLPRSLSCSYPPLSSSLPVFPLFLWHKLNETILKHSPKVNIQLSHIKFHNVFVVIVLDGSLLLSAMMWYYGEIKIWACSFNTRVLTEMSSLTNQALGNLPCSQRTFLLIFAFCYNLGKQTSYVNACGFDFQLKGRQQQASVGKWGTEFLFVYFTQRISGQGRSSCCQYQGNGTILSNRSKRGHSDCDTLYQKESKEKEGRESRMRRKGKERGKEEGDW